MDTGGGHSQAWSPGNGRRGSRSNATQASNTIEWAAISMKQQGI